MNPLIEVLLRANELISLYESQGEIEVTNDTFIEIYRPLAG